MRSDFTLRRLQHTKMTITVRIGRSFRFRVWLGKLLLLLAARIFPFPVEVNDERFDEPE